MTPTEGLKEVLGADSAQHFFDDEEPQEEYVHTQSITIEFPSLRHVMSLDWRDHASCAKMPKAIFFDYNARNSPLASRKETKQLALDTCASCPVREQCYEFATLNYEKYGIWAGTTPDMRKKLYNEYLRTGTLRSLQEVVPQS